eukprot:8897751-Pyramimonas_sp.AAC.1
MCSKIRSKHENQYPQTIIIATPAPNKITVIVEPADGDRLVIVPRPDALVVVAVDVHPLGHMVRPVAAGVVQVVHQAATPPGVDVA